MVWELLSQTMR